MVANNTQKGRIPLVQLAVAMIYNYKNNPGTAIINK